MSLLPSKPTAIVPLAALHPDQILTMDEWCCLNRISMRTGRRIIKSGKGPAVTQVSAQRIGILVKDNARWQRARQRNAADAGPPGKPLRRRKQRKGA
jgi:hypothetical protein